MVQKEPFDDQLGRLISTHPVATHRYWSTGGTALAVGIGGGLLMVLLVAVPDLAVPRLLALALIPALAGFPIAAVQLRRALLHGRNHAFELHENGLALRTATGRRGWSLPRIAVLRANPEAADLPPVTPIDRLLETLGWRFGCSIRLTDGSKIQIDGYTTDGPLIARELLSRCPAAVAPKNTRIRIMLAVSALAVTTFGVLTVLLYQHLNGTAAAETGDNLLVVATIAMIVCIVGLVLSLTVFVMVLVAVLRAPEITARARKAR